MLTSGHVLLEIFIRTSTIYLLILIGVRLSGKREVGQMTPFDLTLLLLLSNAVQNGMTGPDTSLAGAAVAAGTLLVLNFVVAEASGMNRAFRRVVQGTPTLLVHNGKILLPHMAREHVSMDELRRAMREHSIGSVEEIALAVLEVDGSISMLKYDDVPESHVPHRRLKFLQKHD